MHRFNLKKIAEYINRSFDIPDAEKKTAEEALIRFEASVSHLNKAVDFLDKIYIPFSNHEHVSSKYLFDKRYILSRFQKASKEKFEKFQLVSLLAIRKLNNFTKADNEIQEIVNTFKDSVLDVKVTVEELYELLSNLDNLQNESFREDVLKSIDEVKSQSESLSELVYDRIIEHINSNIIGESWLNEMDSKIKDDGPQKPLMMQLFDERQNILEGDMVSMEKDNQALNLSDAQRAYYADQQRTVNFTEIKDKE